MAIIPVDEKVFMVSKSTNTTYSGSAALKAMSEWYTMQDIIDTAGGGTVGPQGPQGLQGPQGVEGPQGIQGEQGAALTVLGSYPDLAAFEAGAGGEPGNPGDAWIILSDGSLEVWNTDTNAWNDVGDLLGPAGPQGIQGEQGEQGIQGVQGIQGIQGIQGVSGTYGIYAQTALGTLITNTTVETSLIGPGVGSLTVPANGFSVGDSFTVKLCGPLSCANNETIRIRIKSDGVVIGDLGVFQMNTVTNKYFELIVDFTVTKIGGAGVAELFVNGQYSYNQDTAGVLRGSNFALISNTIFDTTVTNALSITAQWGAANADNKIQSQNFVLTKVY